MATTRTSASAPRPTTVVPAWSGTLRPASKPPTTRSTATGHTRCAGDRAGPGRATHAPWTSPDSFSTVSGGGDPAIDAQPARGYLKGVREVGKCGVGAADPQFQVVLGCAVGVDDPHRSVPPCQGPCTNKAPQACRAPPLLALTSRAESLTGGAATHSSARIGD